MKLLITGGAGFIGSNLVDYFLAKDFEVVCLDNLATGFEENIKHHFDNPNFTFINGDIRDLETCKKAIKGCDYVTHQAALGSVPRSIKDPMTTNSVNIDGFLNMLIATRDEGIKRFVYAASSSTYGDSKKLPKVEEEIGRPLSPYAITKYINELYADVFAKTYGMQCIGLRYFNVFGKRQTTEGAYAAVIPLWIKKLINLEQPIINGDGSYSRDFTYIENVMHANELALMKDTNEIFFGQRKYYNLEFDDHKYLQQINKKVDELLHNFKIENDYYFSEVFNIAYGGNISLLQLCDALTTSLSIFDKNIKQIKPIFGELRVGDVPHSQASILKARTILDYRPKIDVYNGLELSVDWYYNNLGETLINKH